MIPYSKQSQSLSSPRTAVSTAKRVQRPGASRSTSASNHGRGDAAVTSPHMTKMGNDSEDSVNDVSSSRPKPANPAHIYMHVDSDSSDDEPLTTRLARWKAIAASETAQIPPRIWSEKASDPRTGAECKQLGSIGLDLSAKVDPETSDDEPLITCLPRWKVMAAANDANVPSKPESRDEARHTTLSSTGHGNSDAPGHSFGRSERNCMRSVDGYSTPKSAGGLVYGKRLDLTPVFRTIHRVTTSSGSQVNVSASNPKLCRKVPTPERFSANMRLAEVNRLLIPTRSSAKEKAGRTRKVKMIASAKSKEGLRATQKKLHRDVEPNAAMETTKSDIDGPGRGIEAPDIEVEMFSSDRHGTSKFVLETAETNVADDLDSEGNVSEDTLMGDYEDEPAPPLAGQFAQTLHARHALECRPASSASMALCSTPHINRAARATPASDFIDLTDDEPAKTPFKPFKGSTLADRLFPRQSLTPSSFERSEHKSKREAIIMKSFASQWWAGGISMTAAVATINAGLPLGTLPFGDTEGKRRLHSLALQGKLTIEDDLVFHRNGTQDTVATPQTAGNKHISLSQQLAHDLRRSEMGLFRSPLGNISEMRFHKLDRLFYSIVAIQGKLFQRRRSETLERCSEELNEWMNEGHEFTVKEVEAAMIHLAKLGKVEVDTDKKVVKLVSLE